MIIFTIYDNTSKCYFTISKILQFMVTYKHLYIYDNNNNKNNNNNNNNKNKNNNKNNKRTTRTTTTIITQAPTLSQRRHESRQRRVTDA